MKKAKCESCGAYFGFGELVGGCPECGCGRFVEPMKDTTLEKEQKPDGYVAWHPKKSEQASVQYLYHNCNPCNIVHRTFDDALLELKIEKREDFDAANCAGDPRLNLGREIVPWLKSQGWRIRPVKLVFLDEVEHEQS